MAGGHFQNRLTQNSLEPVAGCLEVVGDGRLEGFIVAGDRGAMAQNCVDEGTGLIAEVNGAVANTGGNAHQLGMFSLRGI